MKRYRSVKLDCDETAEYEIAKARAEKEAKSEEEKKEEKRVKEKEKEPALVETLKDFASSDSEEVYSTSTENDEE